MRLIMGFFYRKFRQLLMGNFLLHRKRLFLCYGMEFFWVGKMQIFFFESGGVIPMREIIGLFNF